MYVSWIFYLLHVLKRGHRDRMVVGFTTTCAISAYHHKRCEFKSQSWQGVHDTTLCDKVCQWLAGGRWFSVGTLVFLHQKNWPPRYNWNIVESGVKHHNPNPNSFTLFFLPCTTTMYQTASLWDQVTVGYLKPPPNLIHMLCNSVPSFASSSSCGLTVANTIKFEICLDLISCC